MKTKLLIGCVAVMLSVPVTSFAHHSFAMFDREQVVTKKGVVREFQWTNPHSWLQLIVKNDKGEDEEWSLECLGPNVLGRMGWNRNSIKAGDEVTAYFNPTRDGSHGGNLLKVVFADGTFVGAKDE